ncbi:MAG: nitrate ABC transporter, permease protein, partial [Hydrogenophaga sp.]|nr:nitrate ABC transporter, permease protein [Hydrogenophaga sp.]
MVSAVFHSPLEGLSAPKATPNSTASAAPTYPATPMPELQPPAAATAASPAASPAPSRGWDLRFLWASVLPPVLGLVFLVAVWSVVASTSNSGIPTPLQTWAQAVEVFSDPFYQVGPNDQGVGWNVLMSLQRVAVGFGLAALVGIPAGFAIGRFEFLSRMFNPLISLLRPVSPLAWLPIGLLVFKGANPAAIWTIF